MERYLKGEKRGNNNVIHHIRTKEVYLLGIVTLTGLYLFEPTSQITWVKSIIEAKLDFAMWVSIKNALIILYIYIFYKIFIAGR